MKIIFVIILFSFNFCFSQNNKGSTSGNTQSPQVLNVYITKQPLRVYVYNFKTQKVDHNQPFVVPQGVKFTQIDPIASDPKIGAIYVIQFIQFNPNINPANLITTLSSSNTTLNDFYCLSAIDFQSKAVEKYFYTDPKRVEPSAGILIVPLKIRPKNKGMPFDFTSEFSLGGSFGARWRISHYNENYFNMVGSFGLTNVTVDTGSVTDHYITETNSKIAAITPGLGAILDISGFQIGLVTGWDFIGGELGKHWKYNGKAWISFGIGYQFLKKE